MYRVDIRNAANHEWQNFGINCSLDDALMLAESMTVHAKEYVHLPEHAGMTFDQATIRHQATNLLVLLLSTKEI